MNEPSDISTLGIADAYEMLICDMEDDKKGEETYRKARWGIGLHFDIYDFLNNDMVLKGKQGIAIHKGSIYRLSDLYTELERRNRIIKHYLIELEGSVPWKLRT